MRGTRSLSETRFAVVDVETSGLSRRRHRLLQVAVVTVTGAGEVLDRWSTVVRPRFGRVGPTHIHGLTAAGLRDAPTFAEVAPELVRRLDGPCSRPTTPTSTGASCADALHRTGYAVPDATRLCTARLSRAVTADATSHRLADVCARHGVEITRAHDAAADAEATAAVLPLLFADGTLESADDLAPHLRGPRRRLAGVDTPAVVAAGALPVARASSRRAASRPRWRHRSGASTTAWAPARSSSRSSHRSLVTPSRTRWRPPSSAVTSSTGYVSAIQDADAGSTSTTSVASASSKRPPVSIGTSRRSNRSPVGSADSNRSMRNVRSGPASESSATTYHRPRASEHRLGVDAAPAQLAAGWPSSTRRRGARSGRSRPVRRRGRAGAARRRAPSTGRPRAWRPACRGPGPTGPRDRRPAASWRPGRRRAGAKPSGAVSRNGRVKSRGTPTCTTPSSIQTSIELVDVRRQAAHRHHFEVLDEVALRHAVADCDLRHRHLAPLHEPRQQHQDPLQALLGATGAAPARRRRSRRAPGDARRASATTSARTSGGATTTASSRRPSNHERKAAGSRTAPARRTLPSLRRSTTASSPTSRTTLAARTAATSTRASPDEPMALGSSARAWARSKSAGTVEGIRRPDGDVALDAVDAERARRGVVAVGTGEVPEAVAGQQPVRSHRAVAVVVPELHPGPRRGRVEQHR